jgi:hypothetical protein
MQLVTKLLKICKYSIVSYFILFIFITVCQKLYSFNIVILLIMIRDEVWIGNWIYQTSATCDCK